MPFEAGLTEEDIALLQVAVDRGLDIDVSDEGDVGDECGAD